MALNKAIVTTSWDDGHVLDTRLVALLTKYGMPATFYIAPKNREFAPADILTDKQVVELSKTFEIGSHTMTHPVMTTLTEQEVIAEVTESRKYLQKLTGQPVTSFCYPRGMYDKLDVQAVKDAGYTYARTVERFSVATDIAPFEAPTALETHRLPLPHLPVDLWQLLVLNRFNPIKALRCLSWDNLAITLFDKAVATGGVFHLWGHSWVIEECQDWGRLERVLAYIAAHRGQVELCTNGELAERITK